MATRKLLPRHKEPLKLCYPKSANMVEFPVLEKPHRPSRYKALDRPRSLQDNQHNSPKPLQNMEEQLNFSTFEVRYSILLICSDVLQFSQFFVLSEIRNT